jgi:hypothetical protein
MLHCVFIMNTEKLDGKECCQGLSLFFLRQIKINSQQQDNEQVIVVLLAVATSGNES